jgi:hypothetical protein
VAQFGLGALQRYMMAISRTGTPLASSEQSASVQLGAIDNSLSWPWEMVAGSLREGLSDQGNWQEKPTEGETAPLQVVSL